MKAICNGMDLSDAVSRVYKACATRTTNPMLECIKIEARDNMLRLTATDTELGIEKCINATVKIEGEAVVTGKFFSEFVRKLSHEQIELSLIDNTLKIKYSESDGKLTTMPSLEFPQIKQVALDQNFIIIKKELRDMINKVAFSVGVDDARPILKGVLLEIDDNTITAVALDGYRLAKCVKPVEKTTAKMHAIVPARCLTEIGKLIEDDEEPLVVYIQKNYLMIDMGHTKITTKLLDGDFVNYKNIIPTNFQTAVIIPKTPFMDGLERAILLARSDRNNMVRFDIKDNVMLLSSNSEVGNVNEKVTVKMNGKDIAIAFNARYFADILKYVDTDTVTINFINATSPCVVSPTTSSEELLYLVLPVRLL